MEPDAQACASLGAAAPQAGPACCLCVLASPFGASVPHMLGPLGDPPLRGSGACAPHLGLCWVPGAEPGCCRRGRGPGVWGSGSDSHSRAVRGGGRELVPAKEARDERPASGEGCDGMFFPRTPAFSSHIL